MASPDAYEEENTGRDSLRLPPPNRHPLRSPFCPPHQVPRRHATSLLRHKHSRLPTSHVALVPDLRNHTQPKGVHEVLLARLRVRVGLQQVAKVFRLSVTQPNDWVCANERLA